MVLALALALPGGEARAEWPERTITIIVPFPKGGHTDMLARLLATELASRLGQDVIVENRVGKGGSIGLSAGASAEWTGYTLVVTSNAVMIDPGASERAKYPLKTLHRSPIWEPHLTSSLCVMLQGLPVADLVAKAKANPGKLTYASPPGVGTSSQLAVELLNQGAGTNAPNLGPIGVS